MHLIPQEGIFEPIHSAESVNILNRVLIGIGGSYFGPHNIEDLKDFPGAAYIIFLGFLIVLTILFNNLLV